MSRAKFTELADELRAFVLREVTSTTAPPAISRDSAEYLLAALAAFERDPAAGLDRAFGLSAGPGRPAAGTEAENYPLARAVYFMRWEGKSWKTIADHYGRDVRDLQRILERYNSRISADLADRITASISA